MAGKQLSALFHTTNYIQRARLNWNLKNNIHLWLRLLCCLLWEKLQVRKLLHQAGHYNKTHKSKRIMRDINNQASQSKNHWCDIYCAALFLFSLSHFCFTILCVCLFYFDLHFLDIPKALFQPWQTDGRGCHARCQPAPQEQFGAQYLAQRCFDMQPGSRALEPATFQLTALQLIQLTSCFISTSNQPNKNQDNCVQERIYILYLFLPLNVHESLRRSVSPIEGDNETQTQKLDFTSSS